MRKFSFLLSRYVLQAVLPYFVFTWLLLSVILFVQQASKHSDLLFNATVSSSLVWQLAIALIPTVISFTCPLAALVGVIIGLSRMQGDSEMVTIRAAGVGNIQIVLPVVLLGIVLSVFALFINLKGVPFAAQIVRRVILTAALDKLESPIEPGVFNSELSGFTIYVKKGNLQKGSWENVFIHHEDKANNQLRLITSKEGRIDSKGDNSEIFLSNATVTTFDKSNEQKIASEKVQDVRLEVQTKRGELIKKLTGAKRSAEEMGLTELGQYASTLKDPQQKTEAQLLWQRRLLLSITPLLFVLLGAGLVTKFNRGGRGFGIFLALVSLVIYYLLTLLGEQLARTGSINVLTASIIPLSVSVIAIVWFFVSQRFFITRSFSLKNLVGKYTTSSSSKKVAFKNTYIDLTTGILDFDLVWSLLANYLFSLFFLVFIFLVFTAFELWKFAGTIDNGVTLLSTYLLYLIPFIYIELAPSALMIATLATYIIKSRQNEIISWTAAGQSVYRLLLPCFVLMVIIGAANFGLQEFVLAKANRMQDTLRSQIRSRNAVLNKNGKYWVSSGDSIYSFEKKGASDNETVSVSKLAIYQLDSESFKLTSIISADTAIWGDKKVQLLSSVKKSVWNNKTIITVSLGSQEIQENYNPFKQMITKPSHLNITETGDKIQNTDSEIERRTYNISLQKKYATPFLPFIIILFTAPFALSLSRKGTVITLGYAIAIWLLFMGTTTALEQFGSSGYLSPTIAVWSPLALFTVLGLFLMTRIRT